MNKNSTSGSFSYLFTATCIPGKETIQGPHQVAQKSNTTILPRISSKLTKSPFIFLKRNFGASFFSIEALYFAFKLWINFCSSEDLKASLSPLPLFKDAYKFVISSTNGV